MQTALLNRNENLGDVFHGATLYGVKAAMEEVKHEVRRYEELLKTHPLTKVMKQGFVAKQLLQEYASLQYVDSVLWVPMLALMKDRVSHPRLKTALTENLLCEAGAKHTSHITLCRQFVESLGISPYFGNFLEYSALATHPVEMMNAVSGLDEEQIAGWILVAEAVVPALFQMALPAFERVPGADLRYLREHITVDADEHAEWMYQSVQELLSSPQSLERILQGIHLGGRTALAVPDALYAKYMRGAYAKVLKKNEN